LGRKLGCSLIGSFFRLLSSGFFCGIFGFLCLDLKVARGFFCGVFGFLCCEFSSGLVCSRRDVTVD
jgi:hypothetical protein